MSREIDERVVQMRFDAGQFNRDIQTSIHNLDELKKGLDFKSATKGFSDLDRAARDTDISALGKAADQVKLKFGLMEVMALRVMTRISDAAINAGERLVKSLSIDQITPGWSKYEQKTGSVQTIMAATASQFSNTAEQMELVNAQLDKLNWFTDETSYNFVDMVGNIGKFTSNNIALDTSVTAMQGIANWAAISGANASEASRAMYNLSQSMATGAMKLQDWMSIENANMATAEFKTTALETAAKLGTLKKVSEDTFETLDGKMQISAKTFSGFRDTLSKGWFSKDVLTKTLDRYGAATNALHDIYDELEAEFTTSSIVEYVDDYVAAMEKARAESESLGLSAEETAAKAEESAKSVAEAAADEWGVSLERATEMLKQFDDETMQFGLKAFKAAQEAKTFSDAIESVKDAVSTGWMKSFEIIFGDYMQAKEFWTNIANTLYDIFAAGGDARNEMLKDWAAQGGREYFVDTIYGVLAAILSILNPIKVAWNSVFGKMTSSRLLELTKRLHSFVASLSLNAEVSYKLMRTWRGLFSIFDIVKTTITNLVDGALSVLKRIFAELNIDILETTASAGDLIWEFSKWYKQSANFSQVFEKIGDAIIFVIRQIKAFIAKIEEFGPIKTILDTLEETFGRKFNLIEAVLMAAGAAVQWFWNVIRNFHFPTSFEELKEFFVDIAKSINEKLKVIGLDMTGIGEKFKAFGELIHSAFSKANNTVAKAGNLIQNFVNLINSLDIDWAGVLLAGYGVVTLAILWKLTDALKGFATALGNLTGVGAAAKGALGSIKTYFNTLNENAKTDNLLKTAIAISALAASLVLLTKLDWERLAKAAVALIALTGAVALISFALSKLPESNSGFAKSIFAIAAVILALIVALKTMPDDGSLLKKIGAIGAVILALAGSVTLMSIFSKPIEIGAKAMVGIALAVILMINAMKKIGQEDVGSLYAALPVVAALMAVLAAISKMLVFTKSVSVADLNSRTKTTTTYGSSFMSIIGIVIGLKLMIGAIKSLAKEDPAMVLKGVALMIPVVLLLKTLFKASKDAGKEAAGAGKMIMYISAGMLLLGPAIRSLSKLKLDELAKGGAIIAALTVFVFKPLVKASKDAGQYAGKAGLLVLAVSGALMVLQLVIKTLGRVDTVSLIKGTAAVGAVILAFAQVVKSINKDGEANLQSVDVMKKLIICIGLIGAILTLLSVLNPVGTLAAGAGIAAVFASIGLFMRMANEMELPEGKKLRNLIASVVAIGLVIGVMGAISDWKAALAVSAGMSMVLISLASMTQIMKNSATSPALEKKIEALLPLVKMVGTIMVALAAITGVATALGGNMSQILYVTTGMSEVILALGVLAQLFKKTTAPKKELIDALKTFLIEVTVIIGLMAGFAAAANYLEWDISGLLELTTGMAEVMLALAASMKLMSGAEMPENLTDNVTMLSIFMAAIGSILAILSGVTSYFNMDLANIMVLASGISIVIMALGKAASYLKEADGEGGDIKLSIGLAVSMGVLMAAIGAVLTIFSGMVDPIGIIPLAVGMGALLIAVAKVVEIISKIETPSLTAGLKAIALMGAVVVAIGGLLALFGAIAKIQGVEDLINGGVSIFAAIGRAIGAFVGGIMSGFAEGIVSSYPAICKSLSEGTVALGPFFEMLKNIPGGALGLVATLVGMVAAITAAEFIGGIKKVPIIGSLLKAGAESLEEDFALFGRALKAFGEAIGDTDVEKVRIAAEAAKMLGEMEANMPAKNGVLQQFLGQDGLDGFGERLSTFGEALAQFAVTVKDLDYDAVETAKNAGELVAQLEASLPGQGGWVQDIFGTKDLGEFATRLTKFGYAILDFSIIVATVDKSAVENAKNAGQMIVELENGLKATGGAIATWFFGSSDLGTFSDRLVKFGGALVDFNSKVAGNIDPLEFWKAAQSAGYINTLEQNIDPAGGIFSKDGNLTTFGHNLQTFGGNMVSFSNQLKLVDMPLVDSAITYIERLIGLKDIQDASTNAVNATRNMMSEILAVIVLNQQKFKMEGENLMRFLTRGLEEGTNKYAQLAARSGTLLANKVLLAFRAKLQIHSPSLVMVEQGKYIVQGVAEGIASDTSAEEAAQKKADNIVSAFNSEISKLNTIDEISDLEFQLWQLTDGKNATDSELAAKQLELEQQNLATLAKTVGAKGAALEAIAEVAGKESEAYQSAYQEYLQAQINMLQKKEELDQTMGEALSASDPRDQAVAFANFMRDNQEAYAFMGKTQEELEEAAYKAAYGLDKEAVERKRAYESYMSEYAESFELLGKTRDELDAFAKEKSGWEGIASHANESMTTTAQIIADNIGAYQLDIQATIEKATAEAIANATGTGGSGGSAATDAAAIGGDNIGDIITDAIDNAINGEEGTNKITQCFDDLSNKLAMFTDPGSAEMTWLEEQCEALGISIPENIKEGIQNGAISAMEAIAVLRDGNIAELSAKVEEWKKAAYEGVDGYVEGIKSRAKLKAPVARASLADMVGKSVQAIRDAQQSASPSKVTMALGEDFVDGYTIGIEETVKNADTSSEILAETAIDSLEKNADEKKAEKIGNTFGQAFANGITKASTNVTSAVSAATKSLTSVASGGGGGSWRSDNFTRTDYDSIYEALGLPTSKDAWKHVNDIGYNAAKGLADGMSDSEAVKTVTTAASTVANTAVASMANALKVKSPSRVAMEIGEYVGIGLGNGLLDSSAYVNQASEDLAQNSLSTLEYAAQAIHNVIESDEDFSPTITPILDLDEIKNGGKDISSMLGVNRSISLNGARLRVAQINADRTNAGGQNGSTTPGQTTYSFTQNNYSPKALNRSEIYRQTNNQFSRLKEASKR